MFRNKKHIVQRLKLHFFKTQYSSKMNPKNKLNYENKVILAPMVRVGTLPMRLLALDYGADIVYTEELIDWKLLRSVRRENDVLGTTDFVDKTDGTVVFRTCPREKHCVVLQLGTCDPERALVVAKKVENDVAAIDINMGCPKEFSIKGGMGVALMSQPEKAKAILHLLVEHLSVPVTCKIRVFADADETLNFVKDLASTGIAAIAVHGRTKTERPQHSNRNATIKYIAERAGIPVIANGGSKEISKYSDIENFRKETGCSSVMLARVAEWNCSIFRKDGMLPMDQVIESYLKYSVDYDNPPSNSKYCVQNILKELQETPRGKRFLECQTLEQICAVWNMDEYCRKKQIEYQNRGLLGRREVTPDMFTANPKRSKFEFGEDVIEMKCAFIRASYASDTDLPKTKLLVWCSKNKMKPPIYDTRNEDKLFRSIVTLNGKKYSSTFWEKNKRFAEQGAALVCLYSIGVVDLEMLTKSGSVLN